MERILIALDYNPTAQKIAEVGYKLAKKMSSKVILLHVLPNQEYYNPSPYDPIMGYSGFVNMDVMHPEYMDELKKSHLEFLDKAKEHLQDGSIETMLKIGDFANKILETASEINADIIVVGSHSKKLLETIILGSTTERILKDSNVPVFIVPTQKKDN
jgi:nucleotide-binding universal stress UspA family protein